MTNWFGNVPVSRKLLIGFGLVLVFTVGVGGVGLVEVSALSDRSQEISGQWLPQAQQVGRLAQLQAVIRLMTFDHIFADTPAEKAGIEAEIADRRQEFDEIFAAYRALATDANEKEVLADYDRVVEEYRVGMRAVLRLSGEGDLAAAEALLVGSTKEQMRQLEELVQRLITLAGDGGHRASVAAEATRARAIRMILGLLLMAMVLGIGIALATSRTITMPLRKALAAMQRQSQGIVTDRLALDRRDELGQMADAFDEFNHKLENFLVRWLEELAAGQLDVDVPEQSGDDMIAPGVRRIRDALRTLDSQMATLIEAARDGRLDTRAETSGLHGAYAGIVGGVNDTLDAVLEPINEAASVLDRVAARDMTARVEGDYRGDHARIKRALNAAVENLAAALQDVSAASDQVAGAAQQITASSQSLAEGTGDQASALEEVTSSLQELSGMSRQNSANAAEASGIARESVENLEEASERMERLSGAMEAIKSSSDATGKVVQSIDEIAFQTNLLALNAAVEAARAGDAGKGFAVVAEEVRNLAMRSAEAAKNTAGLIDESVQNAETGVSLHGEVVESLEALRKATLRSNQVITEIATASEQQSDGVDQIGRAVEQVNSVTQETAASSEEGASTAEELSSQAETLRELVGRFRLSGAGRSRGTSGPVAHHDGVLAVPAGRERQAVQPGNRLAGVADLGDEENAMEEAVLPQF